MKDKRFYIPHLHYLIEVKVARGKDKKYMQKKGWNDFAENVGPSKCVVFLGKPPSLQRAPSVAHEIMHALQYLAKSRHIDMAREEEHFAYLMQWILAGVLGFTLGRDDPKE